MRKFNIILLGLLVIQVIVATWVYSDHNHTGVAPAGPYMALDQSELTTLVITNGDGDSVTLRHTESGWQTPDRFDFPIDPQRLKGLIGGLNAARPDLPVAVSKDARARFHVAQDNFERHLVFKTDQGVAADLYLGSDAGAGRLYARLADQNAIQDLQFPLWRASAKVDDWLDKSYLEPRLSDQQTIQLPGVTLIRTGQHWGLKGLADNRTPDQGKVEAFLDRLRTLQWQTLQGHQTQKQPAQATFEMTVTPTTGKALIYRFYKEPGTKRQPTGQQNGEHQNKVKPVWRVTRSDGDFIFTVSDDRVEPLAKASKAGLSKPKTKPQPDKKAG